MFIVALALSFVEPASACAMPRKEMVAVAPPTKQEIAVAAAPAKNLDDVLAEIDGLLPNTPLAAPAASANVEKARTPTPARPVAAPVS